MIYESRSHRLSTAAALLILVLTSCRSAPEAPAHESPTSTEPVTPPEPSPRPNVILIMTDDQGYGDLGATGNTVLATPHIDRLARESVSVEPFYVHPVCTPTRAALMTGRYPYRTRAIDTWIGRAMMEPEEVTIAEVLRDAGYSTGIFGKWHLGDCYPMRPMDQGFDESLVHRGGGLAQPSEPIENERRYTDPILFHNGRAVQTQGFCTDVYFDAAIRWIEKRNAKSAPFFAYIATNAPHGPFHDIPDELYEKYRRLDLDEVFGSASVNDKQLDQTARIFAMVENIDDNVGRLLQSIGELGIARNTIVIYLHDNGPAGTRFVGEDRGRAFRGRKSQVVEGGIRSPLFVRWPARLEAGLRVSELSAEIDLMPTIAEACEARLPELLEIDGRSLLPVLEQRQDDAPPRTIFRQSHRGDAPVMGHNFAMRDDRYKLLRSSGFGREEPAEGVPLELYDMIEDPSESNNLASVELEIVDRMLRSYRDWFADVSSTRPDNYAPPRIVIGTKHEPVTWLTRQDWRRGKGGGYGNNGRWLLQAPESATFDIIIHQTKPWSGQATILLGDQSSEVQILEPARRIVLDTRSFPPGRIDLEIELRSSDGTELPSTGPYQVELRRVTPFDS